MKNKKNVIYLVALAFFSISLGNDLLPLYGKSFFAPRSQGAHSNYEALGFNQYINHTQSGLRGGVVIAPQYYQAFKTRRLAEYFFGTNTLSISGSTVANRQDNALLADYFGLPTDYNSCVYLDPFVHNAVLDTAFYISWRSWYVYVHIPYAWSKTGITITEEQISTVNPDYPQYYMAQAPIQPPAKTFKQAISGGYTWGDIKQGLSYSKIACHGLKDNGIADVDIAVGWNFLHRERGTVGCNLRITAPTGTRSTAEYLLEPIIGNGRHWQLGVGLNAQGLIWEKDGDQTLDIVAHINVTHLFTSEQIRSFDLNNRFGSRYILVKEFNAQQQYTGNTQPLANITTLPCKTRNAAQVDATIMFDYQYDTYRCAFGYNGWGKTAEGIELTECFANNKWGLKGIANVANALGAVPDTQSNATLHGNNLVDQATVIDTNPPVLISNNSLDLRSGAASRQFTHTLFAHGEYRWITKHIHPALGFGCSFEFEGARPHNISSNKNNMSQWGIWIRTSISM